MIGFLRIEYFNPIYGSAGTVNHVVCRTPDGEDFWLPVDREVAKEVDRWRRGGVDLTSVLSPFFQDSKRLKELKDAILYGMKPGESGRVTIGKERQKVPLRGEVVDALVDTILNDKAYQDVKKNVRNELAIRANGGYESAHEIEKMCLFGAAKIYELEYFILRFGDAAENMIVGHNEYLNEMKNKVTKGHKFWDDPSLL